MNGINSKSSARANKTSKTNSPVKSIETAGSLAMHNNNPFAGLFSTPLYDMFSSSNPFAVDYTQYGTGEGSYVAYNSGGFWGGFYSAFASTSGDCGGFAGGFSDGGGCGAVSSCSSGGCGGGFTSFC